MALVIPGASVRGAAVVPRREAWVIVALLRVLHPLPHVVFTSEGRRVRGGGGRGRGGRRGAVALLFRLPVRTDGQTEGGVRSCLDLAQCGNHRCSDGGGGTYLDFLWCFPDFSEDLSLLGPREPPGLRPRSLPANLLRLSISKRRSITSPLNLWLGSCRHRGFVSRWRLQSSSE